MNTDVNEHSRVCSAQFEGGKKWKNAVLTIILILFAWTKQASATRAPRKECYLVLLFQLQLQVLNHVSTCTKDLIISTTMDEEIMVKLAIVTAGYNTEIHI